MSGWIKIHRKFLDWQWFEKSEAVHLFIYLLLKANHKDSQWQGIDIKRGQFISSLGKISTDTGISLQSIRTLLNKLEKTNEIELKSTNKFTIVTICKYECYQDENEETNKPLTNKQQTTNKQLTTNKNDKKEKNNKEVILDRWVEYRKQIKKPIKEATQETILAKMENFTEEQCKFVINNSIENGWQGLFWDKLPKHETELSDDLQQTANILAKLNYIDTKDYKNAD
jgi:DNA-binding transcriptional MerR regulator